MNRNCAECEHRYYCQIDPAKCDLPEVAIMTRADKIRHMSDEELSSILSAFCHGIEDCVDCPLYDISCPLDSVYEDWLKWIQQPIDENGKWKEWENFYVECSKCGYRTQKINTKEFLYCPHCGAKMENDV